MPRALQLVGQLPKQEFAFNFSIVSRLIVDLHKVRMLNAMDLLSRFSRSIGLTLTFHGNQGHSQVEFCSSSDAGGRAPEASRSSARRTTFAGQTRRRNRFCLW